MIIPSDAPNAVNLTVAIEMLCRLGYRVWRDEDHLHVYKPDGDDSGRIVYSKHVEGEEPIARLRVDFGYFSDTWQPGGQIRTSAPWHEVITDVMSIAVLIWTGLKLGSWRPSAGWHPRKGGDIVAAWWEFVAALKERDLPDGLTVE